MEEDIADINKLDEVLNSERTENKYDLHQELDDFLNLDESDSDDDVAYNENVIINEDLDDIDINTISCPKLFSNLNQIKPYLSEEEMDIINKCEDPKLKKLLILNRAKQVQLKNMQLRFSNLYVQCNRKFNEMNQVKDGKYVNGLVRTRSMYKLGYPYFKTKNSTTCAPNRDALTKKKNGEICLDYMDKHTNWTRDDMVDLKSAVCLSYYKYQVNELYILLSTLKIKIRDANTKDESDEDVKEQIETVEREIKRLELETEHEPPPLHSNTGIDWLKISTVDLRRRHCPIACEALWNVYLHPSINKSNWTEDENRKIICLSEKYNYENWDAIVEELNTNRSAFSTVVHYYTNICMKYSSDRFTRDEDERLMNVIRTNRIGNYIPWNMVSSYFKDRSKNQLYNRYTTNLSYADTLNKGHFSMAEDILLYCLVKRYGEDFKKCQDQFTNRSNVQLRTRYHNYIKLLDLQLGNWTLEEDKLILEHVKEHGPKFVKSLSTIFNRNSTHLRQRYIVIQKWARKNPDKPIEDMVRRTHHNLLKNIKQYSKIPEIAEAFLKSGKELTIDNINETLNISMPPPPPPKPAVSIDDCIINFMKHSIRISETSDNVPDHILAESVEEIKNLLNLFNVKLNIPSASNLEIDTNLCRVDRKILSALATDTKVNVTNSKYVNVPPTLSTLNALKTLLINHKLYREKYTNTRRFFNCYQLEKLLFSLDDLNREELLKQHTTFKTRFESLFRLPSLMSLVEPSIRKTNVAVLDSVLAKKRGRPKTKMYKINRMVEAKKKKHTPELTVEINQTKERQPLLLNKAVNKQKRKSTTIELFIHKKPKPQEQTMVEMMKGFRSSMADSPEYNKQFQNNFVTKPVYTYSNKRKGIKPDKKIVEEDANVCEDIKDIELLDSVLNDAKSSVEQSENKLREQKMNIDWYLGDDEKLAKYILTKDEQVKISLNKDESTVNRRLAALKRWAKKNNNRGVKELIAKNAYKLKQQKPQQPQQPAQESSTVDAQLIAYFQNTTKTTPSEEAIINNANIIVSLLEILNAQLDMPRRSTLYTNQELDENDFKLLARILKNKSPKQNYSLVFKTLTPRYCPPNMFTLIGLRSMLKKFDDDLNYTPIINFHYGNERANKLSLCNEAVKKQVSVFEARFSLLFKWSCMLAFTPILYKPGNFEEVLLNSDFVDHDFSTSEPLNDESIPMDIFHSKEETVKKQNNNVKLINKYLPIVNPLDVRDDVENYTFVLNRKSQNVATYSRLKPVKKEVTNISIVDIKNEYVDLMQSENITEIKNENVSDDEAT